VAADIVLDSSALLAFLFGESSADEVEEILARALEEKHQVFVSAINWAEVLCRVIEVRGTEGLSIVQHVERTSPIQIVSVDAELAEMAGVMSTQYSAPLADAFAAALAKSRKATLVTIDSDFKALSREVEIQWLRRKPEAVPADQPSTPPSPTRQPVPLVQQEALPAAPVQQAVPTPPSQPVTARPPNNRPPGKQMPRHDRRPGQPRHSSPAQRPPRGQQQGSTQHAGRKKEQQRFNPKQQRRFVPHGRPAQQSQRSPANIASVPRRHVRPVGGNFSQHFQHVRPKPPEQGSAPPPPPFAKAPPQPMKEKQPKARRPRGKAGK